MPTCLSEPCEPQRGASADARAGSLAYRGRRRKGAMDPLCGLIGWVRCVGGARRMNGVGEVGARVRVDKLKPWNYSSKVPFSPNPGWHLDGARGPARRLSAFSRLARSLVGREPRSGIGIRQRYGSNGARNSSPRAPLAARTTGALRGSRAAPQKIQTTGLEDLARPRQECCSACRWQGFASTRPGKTYQIALATCNTTSMPHAVTCAAAG
jgi:hypothetical protein